MMAEEFGDQYAALQLARSASPMHRWIRQIYLDRVLDRVLGPTLDVGCGAGQLLERLPSGSMGIEVNPVLVRELSSKSLCVSQITGAPDRIELGDFAPGTFRTLVLSHVLEHFENAGRALKKLLETCATRGFERVIIVVPGRVGYENDATHKTFVTLDYIESNHLISHAGFTLEHRSYFPGNLKSIGRLFVYHELMLVYDRAAMRVSVKPKSPKAGPKGLPQLARFAVVGTANTGFSYAIYAGLVYSGLGYAAANLIALMVGILFSFKTQGILVFNNPNNRRLLRFVAAWSLIYLLNTFIIGRFIALGLNPYVSGALALPFTIVSSYFVQKYFVFRRIGPDK